LLALSLDAFSGRQSGRRQAGNRRRGDGGRKSGGGSVEVGERKGGKVLLVDTLRCRLTGRVEVLQIEARVASGGVRFEDGEDELL
jgi:hypothetical protein